MEVKIPYMSSELDRKEGEEIQALIAASKQRIPDPIEWMEEDLQRNILLTSTDYLLDWGRRRSVWPVFFGLACCAFEMIATAACRFDLSRFGLSRFGMEIFRASPRQADLMIVNGTLTWKMAPAMKRIYDQMAEPKWVIAMGTCAISGGAFRGSYSVVPGVNLIVPVDVYVPGCPPRPEGLLKGFQELRHKVAKESFIKER